MSPTLSVVAATTNPHKLEEMAAVLGNSVELSPRPSDLADVVEAAQTLEANARLKAVAVCRATGRAALADDTGLEVDSLGGAPGVRSARYAGETATDAENVARLLAELSAHADRSARFRTVLVLRHPDGGELVAEGIVAGSIVGTPQGQNGFGYDPVFAPEGFAGQTFAQMSAAEKNAISHRARALRALVEMLE